jgi:hypothetical protein
MCGVYLCVLLTHKNKMQQKPGFYNFLLVAVIIVLDLIQTGLFYTSY